MACSYLAASAQTITSLSFRLSGVVTDTAGSALGNATVRLAAAADTVTVLSGEDGRFLFSHVPGKRFLLLVTMKGYGSFSGWYAFPDGKTEMELRPIFLRADFSELDPVLVTRVRPVIIGEDTVSYNATAFPVRDGSDVEDILKRLPGIDVDINGNVTVGGKPVTKALVDGREFFGSDVLLAIRNLPANVVQKLQVIDDYGDKARLTGVKSGQPERVLNIVLKPDKRNGEFGQMAAAAGNGDQVRHESSLFANAFHGNHRLSLIGGISNNDPAGSDLATRAGINYVNQSAGKWDGTFSVNRSTEAPHSAGSMTSVSYLPAEVLKQSTSSQSTNTNANNNLKARLTYKPNGFSTIRMTVDGLVTASRNNTTSQFNDLQFSQEDTKAMLGKSLETFKMLSRSANSTLYFEWLSPKSRQRLTAEGTVSYAASNQSGTDESDATVSIDSVVARTSVRYISSDPAHSRIGGLKLSYFYPIGSRNFLEMGIGIHSELAINDLSIQQPDPATGILRIVDSLSENMVLRNLIQDYHAGYTGKVGQFDLSAMLSLDPGDQQGTTNKKGEVVDYKYCSFLPLLDLAWNITKAKRLSFHLGSHPTLPNFHQLSPVTNVTNPQYPVTGNPDLKPSDNNEISLRYEESRLRGTSFFGFGAGVSYVEIKHAIVQDFASAKDSSQVIQTTSWQNAGTTEAFSGDYHLTLAGIIHNRFRIRFGGSIASHRAITILNDVQSATQTWSWSQALHLQMNIPDVMESDLAGTYNQSKTAYATAVSLPARFRSASVGWNTRWYLPANWILNYQFNQLYTSDAGGLITAPPTLTASIQRQFLRHRAGTISLVGYNLFDQAAGTMQSVSETTVSETRPMLSGRYFLVSVTMSLQKFR
ncbi:MAG TPA: TonB-dependent receptor [Puia sp.]|nr:TonB-dependent receptor [Puia sp.]